MPTRTDYIPLSVTFFSQCFSVSFPPRPQCDEEEPPTSFHKTSADRALWTASSVNTGVLAKGTKDGISIIRVEVSQPLNFDSYLLMCKIMMSLQRPASFGRDERSLVTHGHDSGDVCTYCLIGT